MNGSLQTHIGTLIVSDFQMQRPIQMHWKLIYYDFQMSEEIYIY